MKLCTAIAPIGKSYAYLWRKKESADRVGNIGAWYERMKARPSAAT